MKKGFAVCLRSEGFGASLEVRKLYPFINDPDAEVNKLIRWLMNPGRTICIRRDGSANWRCRATSGERSGWLAVTKAQSTIFDPADVREAVLQGIAKIERGDFIELKGDADSTMRNPLTDQVSCPLWPGRASR
jgi:hypothetical protein